MWEIVRNIIITIGTLYTLWQVGPPAVDTYFLPTIEYVAGTFHVIAPVPAPVTTFMNMQAPVAVGPRSAVVKTTFVQKAGHETMPTPETARVTDTNSSQWPFTMDRHASDSSSHSTQDEYSPQSDYLNYGSSSVLEWYSHITFEAGHITLHYLRQLLDSFLYQTMALSALMVSWALLRRRHKVAIERIAKLHNLEIVAIRQDSSATAVLKDLENVSLSAQIQSLRDAADVQVNLLDAAREEIQRANEGKTLAEEQSETEIAKLKSSLTDKDDIIAVRDDDLAKAIGRAERAENSNRLLENNARRSRSDFDSTLQKKMNELSAHERATEKALEEGNTARRELKDSRTEAGKARKKITELENQVADFKGKHAELGVKVKEQDATIARKDKTMTSMRQENQRLAKKVEDMTAARDRVLKSGNDARVRSEKLTHELHTQLTEANNLLNVAKAEASEQEALAAEAVEQRKAAEERALQQETRAAAAEEICKIAEEKASREAVNAAEADEQLKVKDEKIAELKADSATSRSYLQRLLDTARHEIAEKDIAIAQAAADAQKAEAEAKEIQETLQERIGKLEEQHQEKLVWSSDAAAPSSSSSSLQPRPVIRLPGPDVGTERPLGRSHGRPAPRWEPPANGKTKTPPEERGLPADTPTGPRAGRRGPK